MCVAAIAWQADAAWPLVVIANRDEYHDRPTAPLSRWDEPTGILAGRDLRAGGTWLGIGLGTGAAMGDAGRLALVTNLRVEGFPQPDRPSRGGLVTGWLAQGHLADMADMNPCNLLVADRQGTRVVANWPALAETPLAPGVHGLSNGPFSAPWAKSQALAAALATWLGKPTTGDGESDLEPLFAALANRSPLPGPGPDDRHSAVFVADAVYGTRCSTVIAVRADGAGIMVERSFAPDGATTGESRIAFAWCG